MLTTVTIQDFHNIEDATLEVGPGATFLFGGNEAGKSSVVQALRWALTGRARGTDAAGKGAGKLVRTGAKQATVTLEFDAGRITLTRTVTASGKGHVEGRDGELGARWTAEDVLRALGASDADVLDAALDGERLLGADHATAKALLLRLLQPTIVDDVDGRTYTIDTIDAAEAEAREARLGLKRAIQAIGTPQKPRQPAVTADDLARLRQAVTHAKAALLADVRASDRDAGRREELTRRLAHIGPVASVEDLQAELDSVDESIRRAEAAAEERPSDADVTAARAARHDASLTVGRVQGALSGLRAFGAGGATCVLGGGIPCHTPADRFAEAIADLETQEAAARTALRAADAEIDAWNQAVAVAERAEHARRTLAQRRERLTHELARARERAEVEAALAALPPVDAAARHKLEADVTAASRALADAEAAAGAWARYREQAMRAESLQTELASHEARCARLGPKGIRVAALASAAADWLSVVNTHAAALGGHALSLTLDPWQLLVDGRDAALLSASARLRVAVAIQVAMRAPVVLVDAADLLDLDNTRAFTAWVRRVSHTAQVLVTATRPARATAPAWARSYWLESGRARALAAAPA